MKRTALLFIVALPVMLFLGLTAAGQQSANPLLPELKSSDANIRARAVRDLGQSGDASVVPALTAELRDPSTKVRREVIVALATLHTGSSLNGLLTATKDSDPDVRALAVRAVEGWYAGSIPALGFTGMVKKSYRNAMNEFEGNTSQVSPGVSVDPRVVSALEAAMEDTGSVRAAREAARGLGMLRARPAVPDLVKAAHSTDDDLAANALDALSKIKDVSAGPQLADLLDSRSKEVKQTACITVGILRTGSAVAKLQQIYQDDPDKQTREAALDGLAYIGDPASYTVMIKALWSQNKTERAYGAEGLARTGNAKASSDLEKRMQIEKDAGVKLAIYFAETSLGQTQRLRELVDALRSRTRGDVAQSYLIELTRRKDMLNSLYSYLHDGNATVRRRLCTVLMYSGDSSSIPHLQQLTRDRNGDVATQALRALEAVRARSNAGASA